jgi:hypothetical protein
MTTTTNMIDINTLAQSFPTLDAVKTELKRIQSIKCRLQKQKGRKSFADEMTQILQREQAMKEVRRLLDNSVKPVTEYLQSDVDILDYDQTIRALRSIQSKKSLSKWLTTEECDNDVYRDACRIEDMLLKHRDIVKPVEDGVVRKSAIIEVIERIEIAPDLEHSDIIALLKGLL